MIDLYRKYGLKRAINAYDKATYLCGARVPPEVVDVVAASLPNVFGLNDMQQAAGRCIAQETGAEWGCVTGCAAAAITLNTAACMTGLNRGKVGRLPDTAGMPNRVVMQAGHCISFGVPATQMIRLAGAEIATAGTPEACRASDLEACLADDGVCAAFAVESYHTVNYDGLPLEEVVEIAHAHAVPLIVDAATQELRLRDIVATGADLVGCSAHKYLGTLTAGVVAGRRDLVEAVDLQHSGIGRGMKVSKEAIFGVLAAFETGMWRDTDAWTKRELQKANRIVERLSAAPTLTVALSPDPNGCPFDRVRVHLAPERTAMTPDALKAALLESDPAIHTRVYRPHHNDLYLNTTEMTDAEVETVCDRILAVLEEGNVWP